MLGRRGLGGLLSFVVPAVALALLAPTSAPPTAAAPAAAAAPGGPGALSHFDLARKDCLGTARNTTSKVWFTVAGGVLSDVYYPTIDNTNVETLQYVVTDGSTFTDLQTPRHDLHRARRPTTGGMACRVTSDREERQVPAGHRLRHRSRPEHRGDARRLQAGRRAARRTELYVRFDATINGNGGGGSGNGGADDAVIDTGDRRPGPVALRHRHRDERREPRLRQPALRRAARRPAVPQGLERLRRHRQRRADPARRRPHG